MPKILTSTTAENKSSLKRILGLPMLTFYGTGMILGAGIYTVIGKAAAIAGESIWLSLVLASVVAALAALSYAELSAMFPKVGGEYVYLRNAFPKSKWVANSAGILVAFAGIASSSTVALAFAGYLQQFIQFYPTIIAVSLLMIFTVINILGIKESSWMNVVFTIIEVFGLLMFIYLGVQSPNFGAALFSSSSHATVSASALIIFAYFGFENIVNFAEETKNPEKNLPRAILLSIAISTFLYVLVALAAVSLLPVAELAISHAPLSDAVRPISSKIAGALAGIALFATANTVLISLVTTSRILFGMARDHSLPLIFSTLTKKQKTPWVSAIFVLVIACLLLLLKKVEILASISSFATMMAFVAVNSTVIVLRLRDPNTQRPFRIPLDIGKVPILPVLGVVFSIILLLQFDSRIYIVGGLFLLILLLSQLLIERIKIPGF